MDLFIPVLLTGAIDVVMLFNRAEVTANVKCLTKLEEPFEECYERAYGEELFKIAKMIAKTNKEHEIKED